MSKDEKINLWVDRMSVMLKDIDSFSKMCAKVDLREFKFHEIDSFKYPVGVQYVSIDKSVVKNYEQAYRILFMRWLYWENDWDTAEPVGLEEEKWAELLKNIWIPEQLKRLNLKPYQASGFINEATSWFDHNDYPEKETELFIAQHSQADVIEVIDVYACHHCFGETEQVFFICELGCGYD